MTAFQYRVKFSRHNNKIRKKQNKVKKGKYRINVLNALEELIKWEHRDDIHKYNEDWFSDVKEWFWKKKSKNRKDYEWKMKNEEVIRN